MATVEVLETAALYCRAGGSDKLWGAAVVREPDGATTYIACWGARGNLGAPQVQPLAGAEGLKKYRAKLAAKRTEGYRDLATVASDKGATLSGPEAGCALASIRRVLAGAHPVLATGPLPPATQAAPAPPRLLASHVLPWPPGDLSRALSDPGLGLTEKANGVRCLVAYDGHELRAYNRQGQPQATVPPAAEALTALGVPFVVDGERLDRTRAGDYVLFDLLAWAGDSVRAQPYATRIVHLAAACQAAGLLAAGGPTLADAQAATHTPGLLLLTPATTLPTKTRALAAIEAAGGEGVIIRTLAAPSLPGDTPHERKHKFQAAVDCVVLAHEQGARQTAGTFLIGLYRPDGAWIAVGHAGGGLSQTEFAALRRAVAAGQQPVLTVRFLPARTVGLTLVEPVVERVRTDKPAVECSTAQLLDILGAERAALIAAAPRWAAPRAA